MNNVRLDSLPRAAFSVAVGIALGVAGTTWGQCEVVKLLAADGDALDQFGRSVAIHGGVAVLGAPGDAQAATNAGAAYVIECDVMGKWDQQQKLVASDAAANAFFGISVSVSGDYVIVGAPDSLPGGAAYVFKRNNGVWAETAKLTASDADPGDQFGVAVSIDGVNAVVGAAGDSQLGSGAGAAYIFERVGETWNEQAKLTASNGGVGQSFGIAVAVNVDTAVVGAPFGGGKGEGKMGATGTAYVFTQEGGTWPERAVLIPSDGGITDAFGSSVAISGDLALVGAPSHNGPQVESGAAYVFARGHMWTEQQKLVPADSFAMQGFGTSVAIWGDRALVGVQMDNDAGTNAGAAYFDLLGGGTWTEIRKLTASDGVGGEFFGLVGAISGDLALVGAPLDDDNGLFSGSAYILNAPTEKVPFAVDPVLSQLDLFVEVPGLDPQPFVVHLLGPMQTTLTPDCDFFTGIHIPTFSWATMEQALEIQLPDNSSVTVTNLGIDLAAPGPPAPIAPDGTSQLNDNMIEIVGSVGVLAPGDQAQGGPIESLLIEVCSLLLEALPPPDQPRGGDPQVDMSFPIDLAFEADLGLGDLNPMVTVTGGVTAHSVAPCPWDLNGDGSVGVTDLLALLAAWGTQPGGPPDFDGDGDVGINDLLKLLAQWGPCP